MQDAENFCEKPAFSFNVEPHGLDEHTHFQIQEACSHYIESIRVIGQGAVYGRFFIENDNLFDLLSLPKDYLNWFQYFSNFYKVPIISRPDFVLSKKGPKLIDPNFCSTVGFVPEVSWLSNYIKYKYPEKNLRLLDPAEALFYNISSRIYPDESILVIKLDEEQCSRTEKDLCLSCSLRSISNFDFVCADFSELKRESKGLYFHNKQYKHVLFSYQSAQIFDKWKDHIFLWELHREGKMNILDNPFEAVLSNKVLLAFLSEFSSQLPLSSETQRVLSKTIPWSRYIRPCETEYMGELHSLEKLLIKEKDRLILKYSNSFQGFNVCVGKFYDSGAWASLVANSFQAQGWIAQEYIDSGTLEIEADKKGVIETISAKYACNPYLVEGTISGYLNHYIPEESFKRNVTLHFSGAGVIGTSCIVETQSL